MAYNQLFDKDIDTMQALDNNEVTSYMNTYNSLGDAIMTQRIWIYENAIRGETELHFRQQSEFVFQVQSLCKVTRKRDEDDQIIYRGGCPKFWKVGYCPHSAKLIPKIRSSKPRRGAPSPFSIQLQETFHSLLTLSNAVTINFERARDNAHRYTGTKSDILQVLRDSPSLLQFIVNMCENQSGSRNKQKLDWRYSKMKNINCDVRNLLNETSSLKDNNTSQHQKIAFDVAKGLKYQLEQFVSGKTSTNNPNQKLLE
jgi:hypothetical protein